MQIIRINGEDFYVRIDGPKGCPILLLSNSLSSDMTMWDDQVPVWSGQFQVIRYEQRGHGRSVVSPAPYSIEQLGRDAINIMDALEIDKAHWCGLSMGGMVGMWILTNAPERIEKAVLANTAAHMGPPELWDGRIMTAERGGMEALVAPTIERWFPTQFRMTAPATMDRMRAMILRTPVIGYVGCCAAIRDMDQRKAIRSIDNPVLVIIGSHDPATKPEDGEFIAHSIKHAELFVLEAAHISNIERPTEFCSAVMEFLG